MYPIPWIDELFDRLAQARHFTKIDLASGYHQVKMAEGHESKTAFTIRYGTYEWLIMPLGLTNASSIFWELMHSVFHDMLDEKLLVYLDDLLVYSEHAGQYLEDVCQTL